MNNTDKQKAILDLAIASLDAIDSAHMALEGAQLMGVRIQIREQMIRHSLAIIDMLESKEYELGQKPTEIITINKESK